MKSIRSIFRDGLIGFIPLLLTFIILIWLLDFIENFFGAIIKIVFGDQYYFTGLGTLCGIVFVFIFGLLINTPIVKTILEKVITRIKNLPGIKQIYRVVSDVTDFFSQDFTKDGNVVMVTTPIGKMIGIITQKNFDGYPKGFGSEEVVAVYVPMSYQLGGFTYLVKKSEIEPVETTVEEAMSLALSAGVSTDKDPK